MNLDLNSYLEQENINNIQKTPQKYSSQLSEQEEQDSQIEQSNIFEDEDIDMEKMENLLQRQQTKLFKLAQQRELECIEKCDQKLSQNLTIFNVPIKITNNQISKKKEDTSDSKSQSQQNTHKGNSNSDLGNKGGNNSQNNISQQESQKNNVDYQYEWIHTYECGKDGSPILLMIHGYSSTSISFLQGLSQLSQKYKVFCIDILGFGLSSRPNFDLVDVGQIIDFFIDSIEKWRNQMNIKQKIHIVGHCFGGYIAALYAIKNQSKIEHLFLVNPLGMSYFEDEELQKMLVDIESSSGYFKKKAIKWASKMYNQKQTATSISKKFFVPSNYLLNKYFCKNYTSYSKNKNSAEAYQKYMKRVLEFSHSGEKALNFLFKIPNLTAHVTLEKEFPKYFIKRYSSSLTTKSISQYSQFTPSKYGGQVSQQSLQLNDFPSPVEILQKNNLQGKLEQLEQTFNNNQDSNNNKINISNSKSSQQQQLNMFEQSSSITQNSVKSNAITSNTNNKKIQQNLISSGQSNNNTASIKQQCNSDILLNSIQNNSILSSNQKRSKLGSSNTSQNTKSINNSNNNNKNPFKFQLSFFLGDQQNFITDCSGCQGVFDRNNFNNVEFIKLEGSHASLLDNLTLYAKIIKRAVVN